MPRLKTFIQVLLLALISPWLYERYITLSTLVTNRPSAFQNLNTFKSHDVLFRDELRNCEDVIVEKSLGIAFISCDPGRDQWNTVMGTFAPEKPNTAAGIYTYDYATPSLSPTQRLTHLPIDEPDLHPLGLAFDAASSTLYIANHARHRPSHILILHVDLAAQPYTTTLIAHLTHPLLHAPNAILSLGGGELLVTNDHALRARRSKLLSSLETFSGAPGGSVVHIATRTPRTARVVARVPFANGIVALNESAVVVASSARGALYVFARERDEEGGFALRLHKTVRVGAAVDNLSTDGDVVLAAGHPWALGLMGVARRRAGCVVDGSEVEREACGCEAASWAAEWSEAGGLREVFRDDGRGFCSSSSMVRDGVRGVGIVSGLYERGILVFEP
ncbi:hypothetical protein C7974DRAFT_426278 [Boeremia exigua]|uniref:uncharacterized protein n=1 Tax=Boeremia exigua TaxID=749465 RepID=UPI001E8CFF29|nr:uncharacterized protein C7974DRAFT_426278 [Boeremia exigua]KAH6620061.1 hypothetical protein C7974DRAFT_426278 [Boeremia exigua]